MDVRNISLKGHFTQDGDRQVITDLISAISDWQAQWKLELETVKKELETLKAKCETPSCCKPVPVPEPKLEPVPEPMEILDVPQVLEAPKPEPTQPKKASRKTK